MNSKILIAFGTLAFASAAFADSLVFQADGLGDFTLNAGNLADCFANDPSRFRGFDLAMVHNDLHGDGISTDGFVTVMVAQTMQGLAMFTLVDDQTQNGVNVLDSSVGFESSVTSDSAMLYVNDINQDVNSMSSNSVDGEFLWSQGSNGDGLAWAGLGALDEMSVSFSDYGGEGLENGFQFVTWNGEAWQVVATAGGFIEGGFSFSATVIPLPAALGMGLVGLAAVAVRRRRSQTA